MKNFLLVCCLVASVALLFSQPVREAIALLNGPPAMRHHLTGRRLFLSHFKAAPTAKFAMYDGRENSAASLDEHTWLASGMVDYQWEGGWRRDRWSCVFDIRTRDVVAWEVGRSSEATPEFLRQLELLRSGGSARPEHRSAADTIRRGWGWK